MQTYPKFLAAESHISSTREIGMPQALLQAMRSRKVKRKQTSLNYLVSDLIGVNSFW